ncbi:heparan-alpha-glucosaminide N-acetyltransferase domain-containing protein [Arthrobacter ginkgonis]|uniref:Heparan-alpha-glucosaminide N-acetyltransferase domain-containing protein n=1 Tax=Arthrobacter ginkgonis TaxID=1630594 RepID=A0ABP7CEX4_9MICC
MAQPAETPVPVPGGVAPRPAPGPRSPAGPQPPGASPPVGASQPPGTSPTGVRRPGKARILAVDAARCLALIGMMGVHVLPEANSAAEPSATWILFAGRASALFALLAGVSLAFGSGGRTLLEGRALRAARAGTAVRALLILALGLLLGYTEPDVDIILAYYGVMFLLAVPLLGLGPRTLVGLCAAFALAGPVLVLALQGVLPVPPDDNPTFTSLLTDPWVTLTQLLFTGGYPAVPWMAYMCAGLAIGRMDLGARRTGMRLLGFGVLLAAGAWVVSGIATAWAWGLGWRQTAILLVDGRDPRFDDGSWWWLAASTPYSAMPLELLHTIGTAMVALGVLLVAGRALRQIIEVLAPAGSMTLTLYSAHLVFLSLGLLGTSPFESFGLQVGAALLVGVLWQNLVGRGPLEAGVSAVSTRARVRAAGDYHRRAP